MEPAAYSPYEDYYQDYFGMSPEAAQYAKDYAYQYNAQLGYQYDVYQQQMQILNAKQQAEYQKQNYQEQLARYAQELARNQYQERLDEYYAQQRATETGLQYLGMLYDRGNRPDASRAVANLRSLMSGY